MSGGKRNKGKKRKDKSEPLEKRWISDPDVRLWQAIQQRAGLEASFPDQEALSAMEQPLDRLMGAALLFCDVALGADNARGRIDPPRTEGLLCLSLIMEREADRLYRLYHGHSIDRE